MSSEPKECIKYSYIWEPSLVDGEQVKLYRLTKWSKDKLDNAASKGQLEVVERQLWELRQLIRPALVQILKHEIEKVLDTKPHQLRTLLGKVPSGSLYPHSAAYDAIQVLDKEGKARHVKGGWRKK